MGSVVGGTPTVRAQRRSEGQSGISSTAAGPEATPDLHRYGLSDRGVRVLSAFSTAVIVLFVVGWMWTFVHSRELAAARGEAGGPMFGRVAAALASPDAPTTVYLTDAALTAVANHLVDRQRGASGKLEVTIQPSPTPIQADSLPPGASVEYRRGGEVAAAPKGAGIWNVLLAVGNAVRPVSNFNVITLLPFSAKQKGKIGLYYIGTWPSEERKVGPAKAPPGAYASPAGFIEVTRANADTRVSEHFRLRDFLTHDQPDQWPKYLVLQPKLVDKLELVLTDLQEHGFDVRGVKVMSGFRTPQYNAGGGNTAGRANLSRHMYGDASDIYIDSDGNGQMDDLNHDGKITIADSRVISAAVDRVEAAHPELVGGAGVYTAAPGHGPFIHIDTRGYRARWMGTSGG
jgi:hypothetical protein